MKNIIQKFFKTIFVFFIFTILLSVNTYAADGWTAQVGVGQKQWQKVVSSSDGMKLAATPYNDFIYTSIDGGVTWTAQTGAGQKGWRSITSSADGMKLAATVYNSYIYTSINGGVNWTEQVGSGMKRWSSIIYSADGSKIVAVDSDTGYMYISTDDGVNWTEEGNPGVHYWYTKPAISANGSKIVAIDDDYCSIHVSTDNGNTWTQETDPSVHCWSNPILSPDGSKITAIDDNTGIIYTSTDNTNSWTQETNPGVHYWYNLDSSLDTSKLIAVDSNNGYVYISSDDGNTWNEQTTLGAKSWSSLAISNDGTKIYATDGNNGYIYTYGLLSLPIISVTIGDSYLLNFTSNSNTDHTIHGFEYGITASYGSTVQETGTYGPGNFSMNATGLTANTLYHYRAFVTNEAGTTYGEDNTIYISGERHWRALTSLGSKIWSCVSSSSDGKYILVVDVDNSVYLSNDTGVSWNKLSFPTFNNYNCLVSPNGQKILLKDSSTNNTSQYYISNDSGSTWTINNSSTSPSFVFSSFYTRDGSKIFYLTPSEVLVSTDDGHTWNNIRPQNTSDTGLVRLASSYDGTKLAATVNGGYAYTSNNGGITWTEQTGLGQRYWNSIASSDDGLKLFIAAADNYIYKSIDGGITWTTINSPGQNYLTVSQDGNTILLDNGYNTKISTDGGVNWINSVQKSIQSKSLENNKFIGYVNSDYVYLYGDLYKPEVYINPVSIISTSSIVFSGYVNTDHTIHGFEWCDGGNSATNNSCIYNSSTTELGSFNLGNYTATATGLINNHFYHYRTFATNASGTSYSTDNVVLLNYQEWIKNSVPQGLVWTSITSSADGVKLAAINYQGYIYTSVDGGNTWIQKSNISDNYNDYNGRGKIISSEDGNNLYVATSGGCNGNCNPVGNVYISHDSGLTWATTSLPRLHWKDITTSSDGNTIVVVGYDFSILNYTSLWISKDGGLTWATTSISFKPGFISSSISRDGQKIVVSDLSGIIYISNNSGISWATTSITSKRFSKVLISGNGTKLFGLSEDHQHLYTSTDGGANWIEQTGAGQRYWNNIYYSNDGVKLYGCSLNDIYTSIDGGINWKKEVVGYIASYQSDSFTSLVSNFSGEKVFAAGSFYIWSYYNALPEAQNVAVEEQ